MRPFFLLALVCAIPLLLWWGGVLAWGWPVPAVAGGAIVWHAHELVLGLAVVEAWVAWLHGPAWLAPLAAVLVCVPVIFVLQRWIFTPHAAP